MFRLVIKGDEPTARAAAQERLIYLENCEPLHGGAETVGEALCTLKQVTEWLNEEWEPPFSLGSLLLYSEV